MSKNKKRRKPRVCNCYECQENREIHRDLLIKNRMFIEAWHKKAFSIIAKSILQLRLFLDFENAKRRKGGRQNGKSSKKST